MAPGWQRRMLYTVARGREGVRHTSGFTVMPEVGLPKKKKEEKQVSTVMPEVFLTPSRAHIRACIAGSTTVGHGCGSKRPRDEKLE